jgi:hypothetical protein
MRLYEMLGVERVNKYIERNIIEVAPLAYMRGRTLNNAFIILDESQNTTVAQMKMFLTRIGFGSTAVVTGDITQIDLPRGEQSGVNQRARCPRASRRYRIHTLWFQGRCSASPCAKNCRCLRVLSKATIAGSKTMIGGATEGASDRLDPVCDILIGDTACAGS